MSAISVRLADSLHRKVREAAQKDGVSMLPIATLGLVLALAVPLAARGEPAAAPAAIEVPADLGLTPAGREAAAALAGARHFGGWAVGVAGTPTEPVKAWRVLHAEPRAAEAFAFVLAHGTLAGQVMALAGLWDVDRARFDREVERYRTSTDTVPVMTSGCAPGGDPVKVADLVERAGAVRLDGPKDDLAAWSTRNPGKPIEFDLVGGGYTAALRAR